mmetsp:Transcript_1795/g.5034  ORF Transcript_1795/g.5034 Transcript_1795/m.5034 type:complete len:690 (+) Transcript_1795:178-2247(+)
MKHITSGDPEKLFEVEGTIGKGSYGVVYRALRKKDKARVAVKLLNVGQSDNAKLALDREIEALRKCNSIYIVGFEGAYLERDQCTLWLAMERCACSCLDAVNACGAPLSEAQIAAVCASALRGLQYLHDELRFIHRDIKASNLLLTSDGACKLCDLGVAAELGPGGKRGTVIGTPLWMSPELIQDGSYNEKTDIWSLGITVIEMAEMHPPLWQITPPVRALFLIPSAPAPRLAQPKQWSKEMVNFVTSCLDKSPATRPGAKQLAAADFISGVKSSDMGAGGVLSPLVDLVQQAQAARLPQGAGGGGAADNANRTLNKPGNGTVPTLLLSQDISIQLPPVSRKKAQDGNGTLTAPPPPPRASPGSGAPGGTMGTASGLDTMQTAMGATIQDTVELGKSTGRGDYGCGTVEGATAAGDKGAAPAAKLGQPRSYTQAAAAAAAAGSSPPAAVDRRQDGTVIASLAKWIGELHNPSGDHNNAAVELSGLLMKPDIPRLLVEGNLVTALVQALTLSNNPVVQRQLLGAMQKLATSGELESLVQANAHHAVLGIAFSHYEENHSHVRVSAIRLLLQLAESEQGREWLTMQQTFTSLCTLARVLLENEEDPTHAVLVLDLVRKLLERQEQESAPKGNKPPQLQWMRRTSRELVGDFKNEPTGEEVRHMLDAIERTLPSNERSTSFVDNIFGAWRGQ